MPMPLHSQQKAAMAWSGGYFAKSVVPVRDQNGLLILDHDEHMRPDTTMEGLAKLKLAFDSIGEVGGFDDVALQKYHWVGAINHVHTGGNSSGIVDGAALVLVGSERVAAAANLTPRARIVATATTGSEPTIMLTGPTPATRKVLDRAGLTIDDIDLFELNEAFASVVLKFQKDLNIPDEKLNVNGGAIAMGHPLGATGAMILGTMVDELERRKRASRADHSVRGRRHGCSHHHRASLIFGAEGKLRKSMGYNTIQWDMDADGIVTLTMDDPSGSANVMSEDYIESMHNAVERLVAEKDSIAGVVITSAKKTFFAGGDLTEMMHVGPEGAGKCFDDFETMKKQFRTIETLGKPVVAAINGAALGGGLEIALACHHRIAADVKGSVLGLPEVTLGLLPGGGGVTRTVRMFGIQNAFMNILSQGTRFKPAQAKEIGLVDELVGSVEELVPAAKAWIKANPDAHVQPWDAKGYKMPGGTPSSPALAAILPSFPALLKKQLKGAPMPAPRAILDAAVEGAQVDFDTATRIESRYSAQLVTGQVAKNMIQAFFIDVQTINSGGSRPEGIGKTPIAKVGVLGAGMMGAGIAYVSAKAGFDVVLKDVSLEAAQKGKGYSEKLEAKALERGKTSKERSDALLARITPTADAADFAGVDFVIEAVFESQELKHKVFQEIEDIVEPNAVLGSNTSTLPITGLASGVKRQDDFIGIHFFSPVDKMPLVEIIKGEKTSDEALARVFDYTLVIGKTPIVVNDSRGFFTSRVIGAFVNEALAMLGEGVEPASIEQAGSQAGYPAPPLQLSDELNLELMHKIATATRKAEEDAGAGYTPHPAEAVVEKMIELGRSGRLRGAGFYEYVEGKRTVLWPGLREAFRSGSSRPPLQDLIDRMLFIESLETQKCLDEGVLTSTADANVGSIKGIGFPPWTGGSAQFIVGYSGPAGTGKAAFVARAHELASKYGDRFLPPDSLT